MMQGALPTALLLASTLALCSACMAATGEPAHEDGTAPTTPEAAGDGEQLIGQPPHGWRRIGTTNIGNLRRAEYIPEDEIEDAWTRRIAFESMQKEGTEPLPDPIEFIELMNSDRTYACGTFNAYPTFSGLENGYPTAVYLLVCHKDRATERSEVSMIKAIQGKEYFYVITRALRGAPIPIEEAPPIDESVIGGWALFMKSIQACDARQPDVHPCPDPAGQPAR